jgi:hypothetical protein
MAGTRPPAAVAHDAATCQSFRCPPGSGASGGCLYSWLLSSIRGAAADDHAADRRRRGWLLVAGSSWRWPLMPGLVLQQQSGRSAAQNGGGPVAGDGVAAVRSSCRCFLSFFFAMCFASGRRSPSPAAAERDYRPRVICPQYTAGHDRAHHPSAGEPGGAAGLAWL